MVSQFSHIKDVALPSLLAKEISPMIGLFMSIVMILVIYNTVGSYVCICLDYKTYSKHYYIMIICMAVLTLHDFGFIDLIGKSISCYGTLPYIISPPWIKGISRK